MSKSFPTSRLFRFGAAYYPDYIQAGRLGRLPTGEIAALDFKARLEADFARMSACGIKEIRIGEFSWSTIEPTPGTYRPECFLAALDLAQSHGIGVYVCTPTATPPKWLVDAHPEILPTDRQGRTIAWGSRRHYDPCNPHYREHARRITSYFGQTFGRHPAVIGWQIDNELGHHGSDEVRSDAATAAFRIWLERRYEGDIARLNRDWFTAFWSQGYRSFQEIEVPKYTWTGPNPHTELAYKTFCTAVWRGFQDDQLTILRAASPGRTMTHNLISNFYHLCPWEMTADLDQVGFDHYQDEIYPNPQRSASNFTLMRSLKGKPFKVLEQQPVQVNWQTINRRFGFDWLWLWGAQAAVYGAEAMHYFSWQRFSGGPEQYHDAVLPHDVRLPESSQEKVLKASSQMFSRLEQHFGWSELPAVRSDVLVLHNTESLWTHAVAAQSSDYQAPLEIDRVAKLCYSLGAGFTFAPQPPALAELLRYRTLVLPGYAFELTDAEHGVLRAFMDQGGWVLSFPRTAMKTPDNHMSPRPGAVTDRTSYYFEEYGALGPEEHERVDAGAHVLTGRVWAEKIVLAPGSSYEALAAFAGGLYDQAPAAIRRRIGTGGHVHLAFCPEVDVAFQDWLTSLAVMPSRLAVPAGSDVQVVPLTGRSGQQGHEYFAVLNFSGQAVRLQPSGVAVSGRSFHLDRALQLQEAALDPGSLVALPRSYSVLAVAR